MRLSASRPNPNLEDQGISFCLGRHLDLSGMGGPTSSYATASSQDHMTMQAPSLHQSKGTIGEGERILKYKIMKNCKKLDAD